MNKNNPDSIPNNETVTIPLKELIEILIGTQESGISCARLPPKTALVLAIQLKDRLLYKVDYTKQDSHTGITETTDSYLWWRRDWLTSSAIRQRQKEYSERERVKRWLREANLNIIYKAINRKHSGLPEHTVRAMAEKLLEKDGENMVVLKNFYGINKLKTKEEEL